MPEKKDIIFVPFGGGIHNSIHHNNRIEFIYGILSRFKELAVQANGEQNNRDLVYFLYTYFVYAQSFKEESELDEAHSEQNINWKICRDLANGIKHFDLNSPSFKLEENSGPLSLVRTLDKNTGKTIFIVHFSLKNKVIKKEGLTIINELHKEIESIFNS